MVSFDNYVFVSHASPDKVGAVKSIVEALARMDIKLWLDRPGHGENHFGFDQRFITQHRIASLHCGADWDEEIIDALRKSGAILACLSRSFFADRKVALHELYAGKVLGKLVACVVDDLPINEIPGDLGLLDGRKIQVQRLAPETIRRALATVGSPNGVPVSENLPDDLKHHWEMFLQIANDLKTIISAKHFEPDARLLELAKKTLLQIPIGPMVQVFDIPRAIFYLLPNYLNDPADMQRHFQLAMDLIVACNVEGFTREQIAVRPGEVVNPRLVPPDEYWGSVLGVAGTKSRRTVAALFVAPSGILEKALTNFDKHELHQFIEWLKSPGTSGR